MILRLWKGKCYMSFYKNIHEHLICPECHKEVVDNTKICMNCGYNLDKSWFIGKRIKIILCIFIVAMILSFVMLIMSSHNRDKRYAQKLIEDDLGVDITVLLTYYNSETEMCFVEFENNNTKDVAMVNLDLEQIGYSSIMSEYVNQANKYSGNFESSDYQRVAKNIVNYSKLYDESAFLAAKKERGDWKLIYP